MKATPVTGDRKDERELREAVRARDERRAALEKRIAELEKEVEAWRSGSGGTGYVGEFGGGRGRAGE